MSKIAVFIICNCVQQVILSSFKHPNLFSYHRENFYHRYFNDIPINVLRWIKTRRKNYGPKCIKDLINQGEIKEFPVVTLRAFISIRFFF